MKAVIQRVKQAEVKVKGEVISKIGKGLLIYLGIAKGDEESKLEKLAQKVVNLRVFGDKQEKMNLSVKDLKGSVMVVSQFTLLADTSKGNRPSYLQAADPKLAEQYYNKFISLIEAQGIKAVGGKFQAMMEVDYINNGPVTIILEV